MPTKTEGPVPFYGRLGKSRRRNSILAGIESLRRLDPGISLTQCVTFLYICENENLSVTEIAIATGLHTPTASRCARSLFDISHPGGLPPYLGLVEFSPTRSSGNVKPVRLTTKGRILRDELDAIIRSASPINPSGSGVPGGNAGRNTN